MRAVEEGGFASDASGHKPEVHITAQTDASECEDDIATQTPAMSAPERWAPGREWRHRGSARGSGQLLRGAASVRRLDGGRR